MASRSLLLAYTGTKPYLAVLDPVTGESKAIASPLDREDAAVDHMVRNGDGVILRQDSWTYFGMAADLSGPVVPLGRYAFGDTKLTGGGLWRRVSPDRFERITWRGDVEREVRVQPGEDVAGECELGVVVSDHTIRIRAAQAGREQGRTTFALLRHDDAPASPVGGDGALMGVCRSHLLRKGVDHDLQIVDLRTDVAVAVGLPGSIEYWSVAEIGRRMTLIVGVGRRPSWDGDEWKGRDALYLLDVETGGLTLVCQGTMPTATLSSDEAIVFVQDVDDVLRAFDLATLQQVGEVKATCSPKLDVGDVAGSLGALPSLLALHGEPVSPMPRTMEAAQREFDAKVEHFSDLALEGPIRGLATPSLRLVHAQSTRRGALSPMYVGGHPRLPKGWRWPRHEGLPLAFIGQIDTTAVHAVIPSTSLPDVGRLLLFYRPFSQSGEEDPAAGRGAIVVVPSEVSAPRRAWPAELPSSMRFEEVPLDIAVEVTVPALEELLVPESDWNEIEEAMATQLPGPIHRVLGHPDWIQGGAAGELVVQIDSDARAGFTFGDGGRLFFLIDDLAEMTNLNAVPDHLTVLEECF